MFDNYFEILELALLFITFPFFLRIFNAVDFSQFFRKGFTNNVQIIYITTVFIFSYLFSHALASIMEMFYNIIT